MDFNQTCTFEFARTCNRNDLILVTLTPFSRSHGGLDCWKIACPPPISWMDGWILTKLVHLYCWDTEKYLLDFCDLDPIFKVTIWLRLLENGLSAPCLLKKMGGFWPNLHSYIVGTWKRTDYIFVTLTPIFKVTSGLDCWNMACLHPISRRKGWILTKLVHLYCCYMEKN